MKIVEVVWFDAQSSLESMTLDEMKQHLKPLMTRSVGYLALDNKEYIILVFMNFGDEIFKHWQVIPRGMIKTIKEIKSNKNV